MNDTRTGFPHEIEEDWNQLIDYVRGDKSKKLPEETFAELIIWVDHTLEVYSEKIRKNNSKNQ